MRTMTDSIGMDRHIKAGDWTLRVTYPEHIRVYRKVNKCLERKKKSKRNGEHHITNLQPLFFKS